MEIRRMENLPEIEVDEDEDLLEAFNNAEGKKYKLTFSTGPTRIFSIRMNIELMDEIVRQALKKKIKPSVYARELIEQGLALEEGASLQVMAQVVNNIAKQLPPTTAK